MRLIRFEVTGDAAAYKDVPLPTRNLGSRQSSEDLFNTRSRAATYLKSSGSIAALTAANELCRLGLESGAGPCQFLLPNLEERWIPIRTWPSSPDGQLVYFGSSPLARKFLNMGTRIEVSDTITMSIVSSIQTSRPFWGLAIDPSGEYLYASNPQDHVIMVIDAIAGQQIREVLIPGSAPSAIVPVP